MDWKKALFLGGAVLLLAACSDATAPRPLVRDGSKSALLLDGSVTTPTLDPTITDGKLFDEGCRSGYYVRSGDKDVCVEIVEIW